jgi:hypothetical protein
MSISGKITRFNMHELSSYARLQYLRERRASAIEMNQKSAAMANNFASIQSNNAVEMGNLFSKMAMQRISKRV